MYDLFIGNKNYSSWSLRPWVLHARAEHSVPRERWCPSAARRTPKLPRFLAHRQGALPGRRRASRCGIRWRSPNTSAERHAGVWPAEAAARAWARSASRRDAFGLLCAAQCLHDELRDPRHAQVHRRCARSATSRGSRNSGPTASAASAGRSSPARASAPSDAFFAPVAFRIQTYDPPAERRRAALRRAPAGAARDAGLVRRRAAGNLARRGARGRGPRRR